MRTLKEQEIINNIDDKITSILEDLRDGVFRNKEGRQEFTKLIVSLALSNDLRARKAIKKLGVYLTELGHEILETSPEEEVVEVAKENAEEIAGRDNSKYSLGIKESKFKKYQSIFE